MGMRELIPWGRSNGTPSNYRDVDQNPLLSLHREVNRLFDDVFRGFDSPALGRFGAFGSSGWPSVEVSDTDREYRVTAELPGLTDKDIEVLFEDGMLILRGEKKSETDDKDRQFSERFYGRFERHIGLDRDIEPDRVSASFKNGVLTVTLPKSENAKSKARRIAISG